MEKINKYLMYYAVIVSCTGITAMVFVVLQYLGRVCK
ncbi:hypothetical protein BRC2024_OQYPJBKP_CDS_0024 [Acinetobacter phage vB_AbaM_Highwayman]|uniref:Uncharacterized protein n=1 Tax=Acinetobacter phage P919 TaxID=3229763 RepID=A0AB39AIK7_9CAUD|nr:hypothetical protein [Acinetobacter phage vB_AbaM_IME512]QZI85363.1 hypothetical protein [Acinetobacter phage BUCT629]WHB31292.1 hypothetical protein [Acinetobacter phage P1068]WMC00212.1 hypothetical protein [Acinetobacter phage Ab31]WMC00511.1 hypothetical protein [Acinetobacter phage Ab59]WMC00645.1 hypothetical protein [Acinetobacter phage Ab65]WPH63929.1 hypothetical protein [Acinetobacter phage HZY2308]